MPRPYLRLVGILLLGFASVAGCEVPGTEPIPAVAPSPTVSLGTALIPGRSNAPWALQLALSGDLAGSVAATAPTQTGLVNECTGKNSLGGKTWSSTFVLGGVGDPKALVVLAPAYHGAGAYSDGVSIQLHNADLSAVWQNRTGDAVSWVVGNDEESGRVTGTLTNLSDVSKKVTLSGSWSCRTT